MGTQRLGAALEKKPRFVRRLLAWGRANRRDFPWRTADRPFRVLVAEVLLQRSRSSTVARVYQDLFTRWPTPHALAEASQKEVEEVIRPLGLTRRAGTLKALAGRIEDLHGVPSSLEDLMELPGVGRYAAAATRVVAFGKREPVVDGVTARVYRRYFGLPDEQPPATDSQLWATVASVTPQSAAREWNWAVLDLAAMICLPKKPRCAECPLVDACSLGRVRVRGSG
jgi:A/G-specific adenine glycosylase